MKQILTQTTAEEPTKAEKPADWLPDGVDCDDYVNKDKEWRNLVHRLGMPRVLDNVYFPEVAEQVANKFENKPEDFSYFEAGCGHGNDFRAFKKAMEEKIGAGGRYLGVDMSQAEIIHGLDFYKDQEDSEKAKNEFGQGNLRDLKNLKNLDGKPLEIKDGEFDVAYFEAVLHGLGHGEDSYEKKKAAAQEMLNEIYRILKKDGQLFCRANVFDGQIPKEEQFEHLRSTNQWRFWPDADEFIAMLEQAGFRDIKTSSKPHEKAATNPNRKNMEKISVLAKK